MGRQRAQQVPPHSCPASHFLGACLGQGVDGMNPMASERLGGARPAPQDLASAGHLDTQARETGGTWVLLPARPPPIAVPSSQDAKRPLYYSPNSHNNTMGQVKLSTIFIWGN